MFVTFWVGASLLLFAIESIGIWEIQIKILQNFINYSAKIYVLKKCAPKISIKF